VRDIAARLGALSLPEAVMIDCSHGNSEKDYRRQADVASSICDQVASGSWQIFGAMLESHLVEGRQDYTPGRPAVYGQSITDACLSLEQTEPLLEKLATAQRARG
jgi:3-deoxy-7-phosphoheptulonate synthase